MDRVVELGLEGRQSRESFHLTRLGIGVADTAKGFLFLFEVLRVAAGTWNVPRKTDLARSIVRLMADEAGHTLVLFRFVVELRIVSIGEVELN